MLSEMSLGGGIETVGASDQQMTEEIHQLTASRDESVWHIETSDASTDEIKK